MVRNGTHRKEKPSGSHDLRSTSPGSRHSGVHPPVSGGGSRGQHFRRSIHQVDFSIEGNAQIHSPRGRRQHSNKRHPFNLPEDEPPEGSASAQFKMLQKEIHEAVERAEVKIMEYDILEKERSEQQDLEQAPLSENGRTITQEDLDEMIPAAAKVAMHHIAETHDEAMMKLVHMYKSLEPSVLGDPVESSSTDDFMDNFKGAQELVDDVMSHRQAVEAKVEGARKALIQHHEDLKTAEMKEMMEMGMDAEPELPTTQTAATGGGGGGGEINKIAALREHIRVLESRINDLQAELSEEHQNFQDMQETKDELVTHLNLQLETLQEQMENILGTTAHELADSAAAVEDTRLHIAYLTIQLRNARELADSRNFDINDWVKRADHEAVVKQANTLKSQAAKLTERVKAEQRNTDEAHAYAKKCLHAKEKADEAHANWEIKLRETLKARDADLQALNFESRLLHHRADRLVREMEETKLRLEVEKKDAVEQAMAATEEQRQAFNNLLQERNSTISVLKSERLDLSDRLDATTKMYQDKVESVKRAEADRLIRQVNAEAMTDPVKMGGGREGGGSSAEEFREIGMQTGSVPGVLWKVLRRKFAIEAVGSLDRKFSKMMQLEQNLMSMEEGIRNQWSTSEGMIKSISHAVVEAFGSIPRNKKHMHEVVLSMEAFVEQEERAMEKRSHLNHSVAQALQRMRSKMRDLLDQSVRDQIDGQRIEAVVEEDTAGIDEMKQKIAVIKSEIDGFSAGGIDLEDQLLELHSSLGLLLNGDCLQNIVSTRIELAHELQISQRFDLSHHKKCLTAITAGDFADSMPASAGGAILSHPHNEEAKALGDIIKEWNRQKTEWVKERLKLLQESNAIRKDLQNAQFDKIKGGLKKNNSEDGIAENSSSRPGTGHDGLPPHSLKQLRAEAAAYEMALNRSSSRELEAEMDALTRAISNWWCKENEFEFVEVEDQEGIAVPPLWRKCLKLVQAASIAFQSAQTAESGLAAARFDSQPVTAGNAVFLGDDDEEFDDAESPFEGGDDNASGALDDEENRRNNLVKQVVSKMYAQRHTRRREEKRAAHHRKKGADQGDTDHDLHMEQKRTKHSSDNHAHLAEEEHTRSRHREKKKGKDSRETVSTAHSHASVETDHLNFGNASTDDMGEIHTSTRAMGAIIKSLGIFLSPGWAHAVTNKKAAHADTAAVKCNEEVDESAETMDDGTRGQNSQAHPGIQEVAESFVDSDEVAEGDDCVKTETGAAQHDEAGDVGVESCTISDAAGMEEAIEGEGARISNRGQGGVEDAWDPLHESSMHHLISRQNEWKLEGSSDPAPVETFSPGHEADTVLGLYLRHMSLKGLTHAGLRPQDLEESERPYEEAPAVTGGGASAEEAAIRLQSFARAKLMRAKILIFVPKDFLGTTIVEQSKMRAELQLLSTLTRRHIGTLTKAHVQSQHDRLHLTREHQALLAQMSDLQSRHQQLVEESDNLKQVQDVLNQELDRTKKELEQALYRPPTAEVEVKTDDVQPEIMIVEQPPSQETLTEIADQIRAEMQEYIEKLKERIAYLEMKENMYANVQQELDNARKLLSDVGQTTVTMASELLDARESSKMHQEYAKVLLEQHVATTEEEKELLEQQISLVDAALERSSEGLLSAAQNKNLPAGADTINGVTGVAVAAAAVETEAPKIEKANGEVASKPAQVKIRSDASGIRGEPCPTCQGNGIKPVPPPKPPTKLVCVEPPKSAGRVAPSPRALKKARIQHHSSRPGVAKLKLEGRSVVVEEDEEGADLATSAARLLKLVDQDFADVAASRDQLRTIFDLPAAAAARSRSHPRLSPRKAKFEQDDMRGVVREGMTNGMSGSGGEGRAPDRDSKPVMVFAPERIAALPALFPPVPYSIKTPRTYPSSHPSPWTPATAGSQMNWRHETPGNLRPPDVRR